MLPCFRDLVCSLHRFLASSPNKMGGLKAPEEVPSHQLGLSDTLGHSLSLDKCKTRTVRDVADRICPKSRGSQVFPPAKGSCFVCSTGTLLLYVMFKGFLTDIKPTFLSAQLPFMILERKCARVS